MLGVDAEVSPFFTDMAARMAAAHLVMSRSGASTVSEIAVIGRPALLVPYPHALDHDQAANAAALAAAGGASTSAIDAFTRAYRHIAWRLDGGSGPAGGDGRGSQIGRATRGGAVARRSDRGYCVARNTVRNQEGDARMKMPQTIGPVHFIGIGGIGMSGIAEVLDNLGYKVQGSDQADSANVQRLRDKGIEMLHRPRAENLGDAEVVVVSTAIKKRQSRAEGRARASCCRSSAAPRCWPN